MTYYCVTLEGVKISMKNELRNERRCCTFTFVSVTNVFLKDYRAKKSTFPSGNALLIN